MLALANANGSAGLVVLDDRVLQPGLVGGGEQTRKVDLARAHVGLRDLVACAVP